MLPDNIAVIDEVCTVLNDDHDQEFSQLKKVEEVAKEVSELIAIREENIKEKIKALTEECTQVEHEMAATHKPDAALDELQQQIQQQSTARDTVKEQLQEVKIREKEEESNQQELEKKKLATENKSTKTLPGLRHDLDLYNYMSCIRWQYDAPDNQVKGYIANGKKVQTFDLDKAQNSQFFITNYLWELMEPDWIKS